MKAIYIDCSPDLRAIYDKGLRPLFPDLLIYDGDPDADALAGLINGHSGVLNGHTYMSAELLAVCPELKVIVYLGTGASTYIDMAAAEELGITVRNVAGYGNRTIAEHAIGLMFAAARSIARMDRQMRGGAWQPRLGGLELEGKTLGIIGLGGVGRTVAAMAAAIGMDVVAWNRSGIPDGVPARAADLDTVVASADVLTLHVAEVPQTEGLLDRRRLGLMRPGAILVNTARGSLVDEVALIEALQAGRLGHAALDVYCDEPLPSGHPLADLDNVTLTPHTAWISPEAASRLLRMGLEILRDELASVT